MGAYEKYNKYIVLALTFSWFSFQALSIFLSGKLTPYILCNESFSVSPSQFVAECLVAANALTRPVLGMLEPADAGKNSDTLRLYREATQTRKYSLLGKEETIVTTILIS